MPQVAVYPALHFLVRACAPAALRHTDPEENIQVPKSLGPQTQVSTPIIYCLPAFASGNYARRTVRPPAVNVLLGPPVGYEATEPLNSDDHELDPERTRGEEVKAIKREARELFGVSACCLWLHRVSCHWGARIGC